MRSEAITDPEIKALVPVSNSVVSTIDNAQRDSSHENLTRSPPMLDTKVYLEIRRMLGDVVQFPKILKARLSQLRIVKRGRKQYLAPTATFNKLNTFLNNRIVVGSEQAVLRTFHIRDFLERVEKRYPDRFITNDKTGKGMRRYWDIDLFSQVVEDSVKETLLTKLDAQFDEPLQDMLRKAETLFMMAPEQIKDDSKELLDAAKAAPDAAGASLAIFLAFYTKLSNAIKKNQKVIADARNEFVPILQRMQGLKKETIQLKSKVAQTPKRPPFEEAKFIRALQNAAAIKQRNKEIARENALLQQTNRHLQAELVRLAADITNKNSRIEILEDDIASRMRKEDVNNLSLKAVEASKQQVEQLQRDLKRKIDAAFEDGFEQGEKRAKKKKLEQRRVSNQEATPQGTN